MRSEGDYEFAFTCGADEAQAWPLLLVLLTTAWAICRSYCLV